MFLKLIAKLSLLAIFSSNLLFATILDQGQALETSGIALKDLKICHQNGWKNLSIFIEYQIEPNKEELDPKCLKNYVKNFLSQYKNSEDYWEIMNSTIVKWIAKDFPDTQAIKSTFLLKPDKIVPFTRYSTIYFDELDKKFIETFGYEKENFAICNETFKSINLSVSWEFKKPTSPKDYFDFQDLDAQITLFFKENPLCFSKWEYLKPKLEKQLLKKFKSIKKVDVNITLIN
ncbi:MAG: hypothetical protein EB053_05930 [Chlamydiae bacterium]|nr:hypothetical protein [Chlamydiota bacterium]